MNQLSATSLQLAAACRNAAAGRGPYKILVGLSGGPDSVALISALAMAKVPVVAAHCNFHLRGDESMRDQNFVEALCRDLGVECLVKDFDVEQAMRDSGASLEMACRDLRYAWFRELMKEHSFFRLAVGHNADDNIETLLLNLLRGSGVAGLKGMVEDTGEIIRPLLQFSRKNILNYLEELGRDYIIDSSNLQSDMRRNFLRNEVLPLIESKWPGMRSSVARTLSILQTDDKIISHFVRQALGPDPKLLPWDAINAFPDPATLIFRFIQPFGGSSYIALEVARSLPKPRNGKVWKLADGVEAVATRGGLAISADKAVAAVEENPADREMRFEWEELPGGKARPDAIKALSDNSCAYLPYPPTRYEIRKVSPLARIHPMGMRGSQLVVSVLRDADISLDEKKRMRILVDKTSGQIIWIPGIKRSRHHLLTGDEKTVYKIKICK